MTADRALRGNRWWLGLGLVVVAMLACYAIAANAYWVGDDYNYVGPKSWATVLNFFNPVGRAVFRPFNWLTWAADYALFGDNPLPWHLTGFLMHALAVVAAGLLVQAISGRRAVALLAAAGFALHPAAPETVTWVGGRADLAFAVAWLPALWLWVRWRQGASRATWLAAVALGFLSMLGKEAALTLPLVALWIDVCWGRNWARWAGRRDAGWWRDGRTWLLLLRDHAPFLAITGLFVALRLGLYLTNQGRLYGSLENQFGFAAHPLDVLAGYLAMAAGLWWLPLDVAGWGLGLKLAVIGAGLLVALLLLRWLGRVAVFALSWMPLTLLLTTQAVASRWFYVPSLGVALLVAAAAVRLWDGTAGKVANDLQPPTPNPQPPARRALAVLPLLVFVAWAGLTVDHNNRWRESGEVARDLLGQVLAQQPNPARPATFYVANPPYSYHNVFLFNTGFKAAMNLIYHDWTTIRSYDLAENAPQVQAALADPTQVGPHPLFVGYVPGALPDQGHVVLYPTLPALVAAQR